MASNIITDHSREAEFVVEGGEVLSDDALEAFARLLIDLVESENKSGSRPQSHASNE